VRSLCGDIANRLRFLFSAHSSMNSKYVCRNMSPASRQHRNLLFSGVRHVHRLFGYYCAVASRGTVTDPGSVAGIGRF